MPLTGADIAFGVLGIMAVSALLVGLICVYCRYDKNLR
jgi:hypothetical protein